MKLTIFGDSHIQSVRLGGINAPNRESLLPEWNYPISDFSVDCGMKCKVRYFGSASSIGLVNGRSEIGVADQLKKYIPADIDEGYDHFLFCFGRVDLDFVWPFKKLKGGTFLRFEQFSIMATSSLSYSLLRLRDKYVGNHREIWVLGLPLPVLEAEEMAEFVVTESILSDTINGQFSADEDQVRVYPQAEDLLRSVVPAIGRLEDRVGMTLEHNQRLARMAYDCGFGFIDVAPLMFDEPTGRTKPEFLSPHDHHANAEALGPVWMHQISREITAFSDINRSHHAVEICHSLAMTY